MKRRTWAIASGVVLASAIAIGGLAFSFENGHLSGPNAHISFTVDGPREAQVGEFSKWVFEATNVGPLPVYLTTGCGTEWGQPKLLDANGTTIPFQPNEPTCAGFWGETLWPGESRSYSVFWDGSLYGGMEGWEEVVGTAEPGVYLIQTTFMAELFLENQSPEFFQASMTFMLQASG